MISTINVFKSVLRSKILPPEAEFRFRDAKFRFREAKFHVREAKFQIEENASKSRETMENVGNLRKTLQKHLENPREYKEMLRHPGNQKHSKDDQAELRS